MRAMMFCGVGAGALIAMLSGSLAWAGKKHTVTRHDTLWGLAQQHYGQPQRWRDIAGANPQVKDPNLIYPGDVVELPDLADQQPAAPQPAAVAVEAPAPAPVEAAAAVAVDAVPAVEPPTEASAAVSVSEPVVPSDEAPIGVAVQAPVPAVVPELSETMPSDHEDKDGLSARLPKGLPGQYPSMTRLKAPAGWSPDGRVIESDGHDVMAINGDVFEAKISKRVTLEEGDRMYVLRRTSAGELETDAKAEYLQRVGIAEVKEFVGKDIYRFVVIKAGGTVDTEDVLSKDSL